MIRFLGLRRVAFIILVGMALTTGTAHAATHDTLWGGAERWVGHSPDEALGAGKTTLFDLPEIADALPRMLTPLKRARFVSYSQAEKVMQVGQFLVITKCDPRDCEGGSAVVIIDTRSANIWFVLKANDAQDVSRCWIGTENYRVLPGALQSLFNVD
jgi:hypothetical protein